MFLKAKLRWKIAVPPIAFYANKSSMLQACIAACLVDTFNAKKATEDLGYFMAVLTMDNIEDGKFRNDGAVVFPVDFTALTFKIFREEILKGVVHKVFKYGVLLKTGPVDKIYLSRCQMQDYHYLSGDNPKFVKNDDEHSKIEKDVVVRFVLIGTRWIAEDREFQALASLEGDFLGPVPSP
ncbi:hypothetical protein CCACVL1_02378 [Corchorus capsularis]|uniref:DNA-directed RNA polymerase subunit n=1 Tax=Corchorus capsularis TaxID=210143 RepID=A0A1R3K913_COCAP|nr:hypothetical protein CCACVL1_02378 [Corchorus capsularis]